MKIIISIFLVIVNLVFSILFILSYDNSDYLIYANQTGSAKSIENADAKDSSFYQFFHEIIKDNATESPGIEANVTESAASAVKAKVNETPYETTIAKLQPKDGTVKYCYSFNSKFGSLGSGEGQFNRPHDIVFDSKGFFIYQ